MDAVSYETIAVLIMVMPLNFLVDIPTYKSVGYLWKANALGNNVGKISSTQHSLLFKVNLAARVISEAVRFL